MHEINNDKIWNTVLGELEVILSKANFTTWFRETHIISNDGKIIVIGVPNSFSQEWLKNKYHNQIFESLKKLMPDIVEIKYQISTSRTPIIKQDFKTVTDLIKTNGKQEHKTYTTGLNSHYTFQNFVVGNSNRFAHAISRAVAKQPGGKKYNPFVIYGGVGLGKTHLMQAIGNTLFKKKQIKKVIYAPCEVFANEFVNAIQNRTMKAFKKKYRDADLLLIDDIQFLSGKEGTQEEFFHTFNALYQTNKQIIFTSDRIPHAIPELADRLSSRLSGGIVTDIKPPDLETRSAILKAKCQQRSLYLSDKTIYYIAENIYANIRELEGALNKIATHRELYGEELTLNSVTKILDDFISSNKTKNINSDKIFKVICNFFSIKMEDLLGIRRNKELVYPRQLSMYLLRNEMNYSYPKIGKVLGGKDHTTIIYGVGKIHKKIQKDQHMQRDLSLIKEKLYL